MNRDQLDPAGVAGLCFVLAFVLVGFAVAYRLGVDDGIQRGLHTREQVNVVRVPAPGAK